MTKQHSQLGPAQDSSLVKLPQDSDASLRALPTPVGTALYLYIRSADSINAQTVGQDYLTFRYEGPDLAFAVCDGVGQSFMGDLAARILGDELINWLWSLDQKPPDAQVFSSAVAQALNAMTATSAQQVADYELPPGLPPILKQALEMQRQYGSESMFVAGRLALGGTDPWIALCWLGDSPVAAIDIDGKLVDLGPHGHTSERWNATTSVKGEVHTWVGSAEKVARVAGYTDGLAVSEVPTDADLTRMMEVWETNPPADDATLFDVRLAYSPATVGEPQDQARHWILALPAAIEAPSVNETPAFEADETRPIVVEEPRTPVKVSADSSTLLARGYGASKASLSGRHGEKSKSPRVPQPPHSIPTGEDLARALNDLSPQQRQWVQAALLGLADGLTSAALALYIVGQFLKEQGSSAGPSDKPGKQP
jgi:hypothetical protein